MKTLSHKGIRVDTDNKLALQYALGGLLYTPATRENSADIILDRKYSHLRSFAFCLEDSIQDESVAMAEKQLADTFNTLEQAVVNNPDIKKYIPELFIRVRNPEQIERVYNGIGRSNLLTGFILPKFDSTNAYEYISRIKHINTYSDKKIYIMPIIESKCVLDVLTRHTELGKIKSAIDSISDLILNVRVGGNDFCNVYGLRRGMDSTIYDISVIRDVLSDIINTFGNSYVVSGPVWEYFSNDTDNRWETGLRRELRLDKLNGFIGKTAIHPSQLSVIDDELKVSYNDYQDAMNILDWKDSKLGVCKGNSGNRMNEQKVHGKWAEKIVILASVYGVRDEIVN